MFYHYYFHRVFNRFLVTSAGTSLYHLLWIKSEASLRTYPPTVHLTLMLLIQPTAQAQVSRILGMFAYFFQFCYTGTPEVAGLTPVQAFEVVRGLKGMNIIGGDLVEVSFTINPH